MLREAAEVWVWVGDTVSMTALQAGSVHRPRELSQLGCSWD